jgi:hypothetical protein
MEGHILENNIKIMELKNIITGWFTTLLGIALMTLSVYAWLEDDNWWQIGVPFVSGFILLSMKDQLSTFINNLFSIILEAIKEKFTKQ